MQPDSDDVRRSVDEAMARLALLADEAWEAPAHGLDWTCRETAAHIDDDLVGYAMQLSGSTPPHERYVEFLEPAPWRPGGPTLLLYPDPATGTRGILRCLDAAGGVLSAVVATVPEGRTGYHPWGNSDASGFAAMGIIELQLHTFDILAAHAIDYRPDAGVTGRVRDRLFPGADRSRDPWDELLAQTGRTPETRGTPWRWDSSVR